ncbi:MAG: hypothetical protein AAGF31_01680 [Planctomycetota bacterium]
MFASHAHQFHPADPSPRPVPAGFFVGVEFADGELIDRSDLERLEELDDVIFSALEGDAEALDRSAVLWRRLRHEAPPALVEESREQYVRQAKAICHEYREAPRRTLARAFAAIEILGLLAE